MRVETPHGPIECRYNGTSGFFIGDKVKGYGWPQRKRITERDIFDDEIFGQVLYVNRSNCYVRWDNGFGATEQFDYLIKQGETK